MAPTRKFIDLFWELYEKYTGRKPDLGLSRGYFFHRVRDCYEKCFYECPDVMEECLREYMGSEMAEKKGWSWQYFLWWNPEKKEYSVAMNILEKVRENMKRRHKWEEPAYEMS
mgnify:CR=1 FL=1